VKRCVKRFMAPTNYARSNLSGRSRRKTGESNPSGCKQPSIASRASSVPTLRVCSEAVPAWTDSIRASNAVRNLRRKNIWDYLDLGINGRHLVRTAAVRERNRAVPAGTRFHFLGLSQHYVLGYFMSPLRACGRGLLTGTGNSRFLTEPLALFGMTGRRDALVIRRLGRRVRRVGARLRGRGNRSWGLGRQGGGTGN
jgi:hypothetical protein